MLSASSGESGITAAAAWLLNLLTGQFATALAIIAVALLGYEMLLGRLSMQRALRVLLGCFIFFGAPAIVQEMIEAGRKGNRQADLPVIIEPRPAPTLPDARPGPNSNPFDPAANRRFPTDRGAPLPAFSRPQKSPT